MPDRHIFRVGSDGAAHPTGTLAPKEPSRAIAPLRRAHPPAVEAPPPSLTVPAEPTRKAKPARRRRAASAGVARELEASRIAALPAPEKPKRTRKKADAPEAKPPRARVKKTETAENDGQVKKTARKRKTSK